MADQEQAGPSGINLRRSTRVQAKKILSEKELEEMLYLSDAEADDLVDNESDYGWVSDSESEEEQVEVTPTVKNVEVEISNADVSPAKKKPKLDENVGVVWVDGPPDMKNIPFTGQRGLRTTPVGNKPIDYFSMFVDDNFLEHICTQTDKYAEEVFLQNPGSRMSEWKDVTTDELRIFFGLCIHMGTIRCPRLQDYWKTHRLFNIPAFHQYMSRNRFLIILRCLHFAPNPKEGEPLPDDRLYKIRPLINFFNKKVSDVYYPQKELSLDESMMLYRGRLVFRQYIKNKRHKYGIKLYMLTESNGLILNFLVYTGVLDDLGGSGHSSNVVLNLIQDKINQGHSIYMDNFYNCYNLAKQLLDKNTYCTGTLRPGRKGNPAEVTNAKLRVGETTCQYSSGILIGKWRDKRDVLYISTEHENEMVETRNRRGNLKDKPKPIGEYNKYMSGIDHQDQMLSYYPFSRKTIRWYKKLGFHIIQMMLFNSFLLHNKYSGNKLCLYDFRLALLEDLLPEKISPCEAVLKKPSAVNILDHLPTKVEKNQDGRIMRRRCKQCWSRKIRKDTQYFCSTCPGTPGLCLENCYREFHKNLM